METPTSIHRCDVCGLLVGYRQRAEHRVDVAVNGRTRLRLRLCLQHREAFEDGLRPLLRELELEARYVA